MTSEEETTWYVAIMRLMEASAYSILDAVNSEQYRNYKEISKARGVDVVAEKFGISSGDMNLLTGFTRDGTRGETDHLDDLAIRLNSEDIDPKQTQQALDDLYDLIQSMN